jgi:hypothetical protein
MVGNWSGTLAVETVQTPGGSRSARGCNETWAVTQQTGGRFTGTFQASGLDCPQSGSITGTVAMSGELTGLMFSPNPGSPGGCLVVSGEVVYSGLLNGISLRAQTAERSVCHPPVTGIITFDRSFTLSMSRQ